MRDVVLVIGLGVVVVPLFMAVGVAGAAALLWIADGCEALIARVQR